MNITCSSAIIINAPEYFQDEAFLEWLNNGTASSRLTCKATSLAKSPNGH